MGVLQLNLAKRSHDKRGGHAEEEDGDGKQDDGGGEEGGEESGETARQLLEQLLARHRAAPKPKPILEPAMLVVSKTTHAPKPNISTAADFTTANALPPHTLPAVARTAFLSLSISV